jgi:hypothetical protein
MSSEGKNCYSDAKFYPLDAINCPMKATKCGREAKIWGSEAKFTPLCLNHEYASIYAFNQENRGSDNRNLATTQ